MDKLNYGYTKLWIYQIIDILNYGYTKLWIYQIKVNRKSKIVTTSLTIVTTLEGSGYKVQYLVIHDCAIVEFLGNFSFRRVCPGIIFGNIVIIYNKPFQKDHLKAKLIGQSFISLLTFNE